MDDIFAGEVDKASEELQQNQQSQEARETLPSELQDELSNIESLVKMNPSVVETPEYKDLMARVESHSTQASDEEEEEEEEEDVDVDEDEESDEESEEEEDEDEDEDIEDVFGTVTKGKNKSKKVKIDFDVPEEMEKLLNSKYGVEDAATFFGSVDTWRTQAQEGTEVQKKLEAITSDIQNLPPDLRNAISLWADGEDHTVPFSQGLRLDFGSDFEEQDVESLVEHYLSDEYERLVKSFNNDKIEEEEFNDKIDLLARSTRKLFTQEKKALVDERVQYDKRQADSAKKAKSSALDSVEALSKAYPNFRKSELNKVRNVLVEGKVDDLIYNADGTYSDNAAELVANMMFGGKMRETIEKLAMRQGMSKANADIVDSSPKKLKAKKQSSSKGQAKSAPVQHLSSVIENNDPYSQSMD